MLNILTYLLPNIANSFTVMLHDTFMIGYISP